VRRTFLLLNPNLTFFFFFFFSFFFFSFLFFLFFLSVHPADLSILRRALTSGPLPKVRKAGLSLTFEKIESYRNQFPSDLSKIIAHLEHISYCDTTFFLCDMHEMKAIALWVSKCANTLPLADQYTLCKAPLDAEDPREAELLRRVSVHSTFPSPTTRRQRKVLSF